MKKKIINIIGVLFIILIIQQAYWYNALEGNLVIYVTNVSEKDSLEINLYLDDKLIKKESYSNSEFYKFKNYPINIFPGKHSITVTTKNGEVKEKCDFYSFFVKRIIIEYQGEDNQLDNNKKFLIESEPVFRNLIIR